MDEKSLLLLLLRRRCCLLSLFIICIIPSKCDIPDQSSNPIGVDYGTHGSNMMPPENVVQLLRGTNIGKVRLYDASPTILRAFANTGFEITVGVSNDLISSLTNPNSAISWVNQNVAAYLPDTRIRTISVGNEVLSNKNQELGAMLLPAMKSLQSALQTVNLEGLVKITTPHALSILSTSYPPSSGTFKPELAQSAIIPILTFLSDTNSTFMVNAYPYIAYRNNPRDISLAYALFLPNAGVTDPGTGIVYSNLFGAMLDAVISAMKRVNFPNMKIGVSETGWPSIGEPNESGVSSTNAMTYNKNLVYYISSRPGTPLRPKQQIDTYIFALFNENLKDGPASERNYGLFRPDGTVVYDVGILKSGSVISPPVTYPSPPSIVPVPISPPVNVPSPPAVIVPVTPPPVTVPSPPAVVPSPPFAVPSPPFAIPSPPITVPSPPVPVTPPTPVFRPSPPTTNPPPVVTNPPPPISHPTPPTPVVVHPSPPSPPYSGMPGHGTGAPVWCVAKPNADLVDLNRALNYACSEGADCSAIQPGGSCFYPNELVSHASYAFNSYYQKQGRNYWNCDFTNNAVVAISDPSYGGCNYPAK